ncbi:MAG: DUF4248 domain-containing protein [Bacteroidaceae bacterium]|jgi:hypothetical protein|nr:DUF4248 domain-containing protein [Bacteroidaceae bacterium]
MYTITTLSSVCTRQEIASIIFPSTSTHTSVARLNRWIKQDPILQKALQLAGYKEKSHFLTPKIIRILERFFL